MSEDIQKNKNDKSKEIICRIERGKINGQSKSTKNCWPETFGLGQKWHAFFSFGSLSLPQSIYLSLYFPLSKSPFYSPLVEANPRGRSGIVCWGNEAKELLINVSECI